MELWAGFILGFVGSAHCIGMCGPIALSMYRSDDPLSGQLVKAIMYNTGRMTTYASLGLLFGMLGSGIKLTGYQDILSIVLGLGILLYIVVPKLNIGYRQSSLYSSFFSSIHHQIANLFKKQTIGSTFLIGILNGLLPCGFVMIGIMTSLVTPSPLHSMWYMMLFGLGTLPAMLAMNMAPALISPKLRSKIRPYTQYFAVFIALFLIYRGFMVGDMTDMHQGM